MSGSEKIKSPVPWIALLYILYKRDLLPEQTVISYNLLVKQFSFFVLYDLLYVDFESLG